MDITRYIQVSALLLCAHIAQGSEDGTMDGAALGIEVPRSPLRVVFSWELSTGSFNSQRRVYTVPSDKKAVITYLSIVGTSFSSSDLVDFFEFRVVADDLSPSTFTLLTPVKAGTEELYSAERNVELYLKPGDGLNVAVNATVNFAGANMTVSLFGYEMPASSRTLGP